MESDVDVKVHGVYTLDRGDCSVIFFARQGMKRSAHSPPETPRGRPADALPDSVYHQDPTWQPGHVANIKCEAYEALAIAAALEHQPCSDSGHPCFIFVLRILLQSNLLPHVAFAWRWRAVARQGL
jgi:hypothetical protein